MSQNAFAPAPACPAETTGNDPELDALVTAIIGRVADKWTMLVIEALDVSGLMRFTRLSDAIGGISQKMLTKTLRAMEADGLVTRTIHPVVPPRVDYELTTLGRGLGHAFCGVWTWAEANRATIMAARAAFAARTTGKASEAGLAVRADDRAEPVGRGDAPPRGPFLGADQEAA